MQAHLKALLITATVLLLLVIGYKSLNLGGGGAEVIAKKPLTAEKPQLPQIDLVSLTGKKINAEFLKDKVIIFNFWASWCSPCIEEVPSLITLVKADPSIIIIAVSGDQNRDDVTAFIKSFPDFNKPPVYIVLENAKLLMEHFGVDKLPESFIFNNKGEMVKKISGTINWHTPESIEYFKSLRVP